MVALFLEDNKTSDDGDGKENGKKKKKKKEKKLPCYTAVARLGFKRRATAVPNSIHKL